VDSDGQVTFCPKYLFSPLLILSTVFHTLLRIKILNKKYTCKNESTTCSTGLKKIHLFVRSLVEGPFLYCLFFSLNFIFLDLFCSYSFCCKCRPCDIKVGADCIFYRISWGCLCFSLIMIFWFRNDIWVIWQCWLIWVLWWMNSCAINGRGKECTQTFISVASAVPEINALHSAVRISLWRLWTVGSYLCLSSTEHFSLFLLRAIMCNRPGTSEVYIT